MARVTKDEFGTSLVDAKPATPAKPATSTGTPFGQAPTNAASAAVANPTVANINTFIAGLQGKLAAANVSLGLNPDGTKPDTTGTRVSANQAKKDAGPPYTAPAGFHWTWIGTEYKLYQDATSGGGAGAGGTGGAVETGKKDTTDTTGTPTTSVDVLKAMLRGFGFTSAIVDSSASYLNSLLKEGLDYDNAVQVYLNSKDYTLKNGTKITSPFYEQYGYLNEGLAQPKGASELYNAVEGYKAVKAKYGFSDKYLSTESLRNYVKNNVTVADLDERANAARLAAINADPAKSEALVKLGYIANAADLQDFYMDAKIGKEQLELNRNTGAFVAEAIRRAGSGLLVENIQLANYKKLAAELTAKGYSEAQIAQLASTGFQNVAESLKPTVALSGIYNKTVENQATISDIQTQLQQEEFSNMPSKLRKQLAEQNKLAFAGESGVYSRLGMTGSLGSTSTGGIL